MASVCRALPSASSAVAIHQSSIYWPAHSEVHYFWNIGPMACLDGHLVLIFFRKLDIVISMPTSAKPDPAA